MKDDIISNSRLIETTHKLCRNIIYVENDGFILLFNTRISPKHECINSNSTVRNTWLPVEWNISKDEISLRSSQIAIDSGIPEYKDILQDAGI